MVRAPWEDDPLIDEAGLGEQPAQQVMGIAAPPATPPVQAPQQQPVDPAAPWNADNPAPLVDTGGAVMFNDEMPEQAASKLAPEDEQQLLRILQTGTAVDARTFAASKGFGGKDNFDEVIAARDKGLGVNSGVVYDLPALPGDGGGDRGATAAFAQGMGDVPTFGTIDELGAVIDSIGGTEGRETVWNSDRSLKDILFSNIDINRGIIEGDAENHPVARLAGQIVGGLPIPTGLRGVALKAGTQALREGRTLDEARRIAAVAARNRTTAVGAGTGGAYGFGSGEGNPLERVDDAAVGAAGGAAAGAVVGKIAEAVAPRIVAKAASARAAPVSEARQFAGAAGRQNIDYLAADVPNALPAQWLTALTNLTLGGIPLTTAAEKTVASAKAARDRVARGIGLVGSEESAGKAAQRGARQWLADTETKAGKLYEAVPIAPDADASVVSTRSALGELNVGLESNAELSALISDPRMKGFEAAFTAKTKQVPTGLLDVNGNPITREVASGGVLSWGDLKAFRTYIGEKAGAPALQSDTSQKALKRLYAGLSADMEATAKAQGVKAFSAFKRANDYYRGREGRIDTVIADVLGKDFDKGGQPAFEAVNRLARKEGGNPTKLALTLRSMAPDEASSVRATILSRLGRATAGKQDDEGTIFSPAEFMTQWNKISDEAKGVLFQNEHRRALDDLAEVMAGMKASSRYANTSKTGIAVGATGTISAAMDSMLLGGLAIAGQIGAGKFLASPTAVRWLTALGKKPNPQAVLAHINGLTKIARSEPAIANEVFDLQRRLAEAFTLSPARLAADEGGNESGGVVGQDQQ